MATTIYFWRYTCPRTGKRRRTRHRMTEDEAKVQLLDPVRVEFGALTVQPVETMPSGIVRSRLVPEGDDGVGAK